MTSKLSPPPTPPGRKAGPSPPKKHKATTTNAETNRKIASTSRKDSLPPPPPTRGPPPALPRPWPVPFAAGKARAVIHRPHQKTPISSNTTTSKEAQNNKNLGSKKRPKFPTPLTPDKNEPIGRNTHEKSSVNSKQLANSKKKNEQKASGAHKTQEEATRNTITLKLRFTPDTEYKHYGLSTPRKHDNPIIMHFRKFMQRCINVAGKDIVFKTFTTEKEFNYAACLKNDREAAEELLAHQVEKQRHTHELLIKLEIGILFQQFKNGMYPWMRSNSTFMIDHPYSKKQIETTRIGFIRSKHPNDTFRLDYQNELNTYLLKEFENKEDDEVKDILMKETGDDSKFPTIRVITQFISCDTGDFRLETRGLVIECLKSDRKFILRRVEKLFPTDSPYRFIPFNMPYNKNIQRAPEVYASIIHHHMTGLENQFTFPIIRVSDDNMHRETSAGISIKDLLEQDPSILSVERTPGTKGIGKWNIITTRENRADAEKHFDESIKVAQITMDLEDKIGKMPFRVDISPISDEYMKNVINASVKAKSYSNGSMTSSITSDETMSSIESRFENIETKCKTTIKNCGVTVKQMEEQHLSHWDKIKEDFKQERNEFKEFLQSFQKENNEKFKTLFEFKQQQDTENIQVQLEMATLRSEISQIRRQMKADRSKTEVKLKQLQSDIDDVRQEETIDFITASTAREDEAQPHPGDSSDNLDTSSENSKTSDSSQMSFNYFNDEDGLRIPGPEETINSKDPSLLPAPDPLNTGRQE